MSVLLTPCWINETIRTTFRCEFIKIWSQKPFSTETQQNSVVPNRCDLLNIEYEAVTTFSSWFSSTRPKTDLIFFWVARTIILTSNCYFPQNFLNKFAVSICTVIDKISIWPLFRLQEMDSETYHQYQMNEIPTYRLPWNELYDKKILTIKNRKSFTC